MIPGQGSSDLLTAVLPFASVLLVALLPLAALDPRPAVAAAVVSVPLAATHVGILLLAADRSPFPGAHLYGGAASPISRPATDVASPWISLSSSPRSSSPRWPRPATPGQPHPTRTGGAPDPVDGPRAILPPGSASGTGRLGARARRRSSVASGVLVISARAT